MKKNNPAYFWPAWFLASYNKKEQIKIKASLLKKICAGQSYLWEALNIYDDILDGSSDAKELPLANTYFRNFLEIYYRLGLSDSFYRIFNNILRDLDDANDKEFAQSKLEINDGLINYPKKLPKFDNLKDLSKKSLALGIGPLAILYLINKPKSSFKVSGLINFFSCALAAKQLSDDVKDWLEDLKNGAITYPNSLILNKAKENHIVLNLKKKPEILYLLFSQVAPRIGQDINALCFLARREAKKIKLAQNNPLLLDIIAPLEKAVLKAQNFEKLLSI